MNDLDKFKEQSVKHDLCSSYLNAWDGSKSKKELFELACDSNSVSWMCKSLREGWGLDPNFIAEKFKAYLNGKYICLYEVDESGATYTSAMLCKNTYEYEVKSTITVILDSQCEIFIPSSIICSLYVCPSSNIYLSLSAGSKAYIYNYGGKVELATPEYEKGFILKNE